MLGNLSDLPEQQASGFSPLYYTCISVTKMMTEPINIPAGCTYLPYFTLYLVYFTISYT